MDSELVRGLVIKQICLVDVEMRLVWFDSFIK